MQLAVGSVLFGAGWGICGMCPGSAIVAAVATPFAPVLAYVGGDDGWHVGAGSAGTQGHSRQASYGFKQPEAVCAAPTAWLAETG